MGTNVQRRRVAVKRAGRIVDVGFTWLLTAGVVVNGAIAITALVAAVWSLGDFVSPLLWKCGAWAIIGALLLSLDRENRRLKSTPAWSAAADAFGQGYERGYLDGRRTAPTSEPS